MLPQLMSTPLITPSLARPKYPPPLYFDSSLGHSVSAALQPHSSTSPNKVDRDRLLPQANNCRFENGAESFDSGPSPSVPRALDMFERHNSTGSSYSTSSDAHTATATVSQTDYASQRELPLSGRTSPAELTSPREDGIPNRFISKSPSPTEIHHASSFPHPLSAPHSQEHFSNIDPPSFGSDMNRYTPLHNSDRYSRNGPHQQSSGVDKYSFPLLDQRRMSEPSIFGSSGSAHASAYPNPNTEPTTGRYQQMQFAFNPPPQSPESPYSTLHNRESSGSLRDLSHHYQQPNPAWKSDDHMQLQLHSISGVGLDEPISPLHSTFSGGARSPTLSPKYPSVADDAYGPSPPGTGTSTSSNAPGTRNSGPGGAAAGSGTSANGKTYAFVSLPGNAVKKRPRRRYDEIERLYQCSWPDCTKAYGTLNHLNAHVTMQKHGSKRSPNEFKELRKQWRKAKKDDDVVRTHVHDMHDGHGSRHGSMPRDRLVDHDLHGYHHHRHLSHHHPYHTSHHSSHGSSSLSSSVSVPSLGLDGRYPAVPIDDIRYPPADELDGMPRGHGAEDAFRRGSHPDLRGQARYHGSGPGSWHGGMLPSRTTHPHYLPSAHTSSHLNLSAGLPANADVSLNRLGPGSTLLTPLPGYEPPSLVHVENGLNMYGGYAGGVYGDDDGRPDTGHRSLYDDRPHTGHGSLYGDDRPSTGNGSVYDDRPSTGHGSLYSDDRPGTGRRSLYDDGRPMTGHGSDRGGDFRHM